MEAQIDAMGQMLTDEEKERYEIIQANLASGITHLVAFPSMPKGVARSPARVALSYSYI